MEFDNYMYQTVDKEFVETIVGKLKSQGIFDQFRKDCLADVDTKPAYQNLQERVNGTVASFLEKHKWQENLNKTQLRESLRRHVQQGFLETGVDRIVDQVVNPKIYTVFKPKVEDIVYDSLGIPKPNKTLEKDSSLLSFMLKHPPPPHPPPPVKNSIKSNVVKLDDLLPKDLDPISPGSVDDLSLSPTKEEENSGIVTFSIANNDSPAFEPISQDHSNEESKISSSDLTSLDSTKNSTQAIIKTEINSDLDSNTDSIGQKPPSSPSSFKNFSNLNEKIKQSEIKHEDTELTDIKEELEDEKDKSIGQSDIESTLEQDNAEKLEKEESSSLKLHSEDSRSSVSSFSREKKSSSITCTDVDEKFNDSQKSLNEKIDDFDSSLSNIDKTEVKSDSSDKKEEKMDRKHSETSSSKHRHNRHSHDSKYSKSHEKKDRSRSDRKEDKSSRSNKSEKDKRHHDDHHKSTRRDDKHRDYKESKTERSEKSKSKHGDNKSENEHSVKPKWMVSENFERNRDPLGLMLTEGHEEFVDDENNILKPEKDYEITEEEAEKIEKYKSRDGEKDDETNKSKHKEEKSDKVRSKDNEEKSKDRRSKDDRNGRSGDRSDKGEKSGKHKEVDENNKDRSSKSEKNNKHKESKLNNTMENAQPSSMKDDRSKNDDKDSEKERSKKHGSNGSSKSKSKYSSSGSSGKIRSSETKEDKKDKDSRKRKGERCGEIKVKESRRSSDRDHNGPGSGFSGTTGRTKDSNSSSSKKSNENCQEPSGQEGSSYEENTDTIESVEQPNDFDLLLMKINDSIENEENNKNEEDKPFPSLKKPKIANNIFEIKKIMQARRNIEKMEALETQAIVEDPPTDEISCNLITEVESEPKEPMEIEIILPPKEIEEDVQLPEDSACILQTDNECIELNEQIEQEIKIQEVVEDDTSNEDHVVPLQLNEEIQPEEEFKPHAIPQPNLVKKRKIANNIYEVRKIMLMRKRLMKKQKQEAEALLWKEIAGNTDQAENIINENKTTEIQNEELILENEINKEIEGIEDMNAELVTNKLAGENEIINALQENENSDTGADEIEEYREDNAENVEPPTRLKTPKIARNIFEVRKIIRARKALKRKLQSKTIELNISRKHIKTVFNKKLINSKRKNEQLIKMKLKNKGRKENMKRPRKLLGRKDNSKLGDEDEVEEDMVEEIKQNEVDSNSTSLVLKINEEPEKMEENETVVTKEDQDSFFGFSDNDFDLAVRQLEELRHCLKIARIKQPESIIEKLWNNTLDGNSNMVKSSQLITRNRRMSSAKKTIKTLKLSTHDRVVRDILNGKNGCSIKLTKIARLDEQAINVTKCIQPINRMDNDVESNLEEISNTINDEINAQLGGRVLPTSMTEAMFDNLMKESQLIPESDSLEYDESLSNSDEKFANILINKKEEVTAKESKSNKSNKSFESTKQKNTNNNEPNLIKKGINAVDNNHTTNNKIKNNNSGSQEEKTRRTTRTSVRSTQRYDSTDLYKPRLTLSHNSSRTRFKSVTETTSTCPVLSNLRRKVR